MESREVQGALAELDAEAARRRLADFLALLSPTYERPPHARLICEHLEALERRDINRLIVSMPPRHGKTLHVSQAFPAWWLGRRPSESIILASYGAQLAEDNSRRARAFVADGRYPFTTGIAADSAAVNRWATATGGGVIAAGVGGAITGFGAHLLVIDDPVKGREEAESAVIRDRTYSWFTNDALSRLQPNAAVLLTQTRWHEGDLTGCVLNGPDADEWTVLSLPALAEEDDPLGRVEGEALWPEWFNEAALAKTREGMGSRVFAALYQQRPAPAEGATFKRAWLEGRFEKLPKKVRIIQGVDASFGKGVQSDYSAIVTVATDGRDYRVLHAARGRWDFNALCAAIKSEADAWHPEAVIVEDAAAGQSAIQELKRTTGLPIVPVKPLGAKIARADGVSPLFEAGRVFFPAESSRWREELIEELASFPSGRYDDQVDALVHVLARLRSRGESGGGIAGVVHHARPGDRRRELAQQSTEDALREHEAAKERRAAQRERERERAAARPLGETDPRYG
jgi:predicted phage terminase large subunit-like protein